MAKDKWTGFEISTKESIKQLIIDNDIEMIRLEFVDILGITRGKIMPSEMFEELFEDGSACASAIFLMSYDNTVSSVKSLSETADDLKIIVDPSTFVILPYVE